MMVPLHRIALTGGIGSFKLQASGSSSLRIDRDMKLATFTLEKKKEVNFVVVRDRRGACLHRKLIPFPRQAAPWHA